MRLAGRRVLITGTAGGQGAAAQAMFTREGARISSTHPARKHLLRAGGGSIINTASMSGLRGIAPLGQTAHESSWVTGQNYSIDGGVTAGFR